MLFQPLILWNIWNDARCPLMMASSAHYHLECGHCLACRYRERAVYGVCRAEGILLSSINGSIIFELLVESFD
jgi:hypothetical protein